MIDSLTVDAREQGVFLRAFHIVLRRFYARGVIDMADTENLKQETLIVAHG